MTIRFRDLPHPPGGYPWRSAEGSARLHHAQRMYWIYDLLGATSPVQGSTKDVDKSCLPRPLASPYSRSHCLRSELGPAIQGSSGGNVASVARRRNTYILKRKNVYILTFAFFHFSFKGFDSHRLFNPTSFCIFHSSVCAGFAPHFTFAMLFKFFSLSALSAITLLTQTSTQTSHHQRRSRAYHLGDHKPMANQRRDVTQPEIVQLQSEYSQFKGWMTTFFASANANDPGVAALHVQFTAYDGWISNFFGQAGIASASAALNVPMASSPPASVTSAPVSSLPPVSAPSTSAGLSSPTRTASPPYANSTGPANVPAAGPTGTGSAGAVATFNAKARTNQAVYYGQSPQTANVTLGTICEDPSVDIVILAFLKTFFGPGGYPVLNLGAACGSDATTEAQAKGATGILNCPEVAGNITICQNKGKKVMLSLGGADGTTVFASEQQAVAFATTVWDIFGGGASDVGRPFGNIKLDGFDIGQYPELNV